MWHWVQYMDRAQKKDSASPRSARDARRGGLRETVRRIGVETWRFGRRWVVGLPRRVAELVLPPHIICPPCFEHLSLEQWRENAKHWHAQYEETVFEWLESRNLPPVPRDEYCPEKRKWVEDMSRDEREAYLKEVRS